MRASRNQKQLFYIRPSEALNQIIEKSNEHNLPRRIAFIDYKKAFDTIEHFAIFEALRKKNPNINETSTAKLQQGSVYID